MWYVTYYPHSLKWANGSIHCLRTNKTNTKGEGREGDRESVISHGEGTSLDNGNSKANQLAFHSESFFSNLWKKICYESPSRHPSTLSCIWETLILSCLRSLPEYLSTDHNFDSRASQGQLHVPVAPIKRKL